MYDSLFKVLLKDIFLFGGKVSKWQLFLSVDFNLIGDNDLFSLGDSEDEKDVKDVKEKLKDSKVDESERLK